MSGIGIKFGAEGEQEFKKALNEINQAYKVLGSEMKLVQSQFDKNDNSVEALTARNETLNKQIDAQKDKIATLKAALDNAAASFGENDKRTQAWQIKLNNAEAALNGMERDLKKNNDAIEEAGKSMNESAEAADDMGKEIEDSGKAAERSEGRFSGLGSALKGIAGTMAAVTAAAAAAAVKIGKEVVTAYADFEQLYGGVETLFGAGGQSLEEYAKSVGKSTQDAKKEFEQLESAQKKVVDNARDAFKTAGMSANEYMETVTGFSASLIQSLGRGEQQDLDAMKSSLDAQLQEAKFSLEDGYKEVKKNWDARIALAKKNKDENVSVLIEQRDQELTMLKRSNQVKLDEMKKHNAEQLKQADEANSKSEKSAANMEKAADLADQAVVDMADNANKMGTDIASIQNAYQGFAKQNYTMLDNLKLGYGGTKEEMQRLIKDAAAVNDSVDENSLAFDNIVIAIHTMQEQMGIAGATSEEAMGTISGSIDMTKSAFENFVTGLGDKNADIKKLTGDIVVAFQAVVENIQPVLKNIAAALPEAVSAILDAAKELLPTFLDTAINLITEIVTSLSESLPEILPVLFDALFSLLDSLLTDGLPTLLDSLTAVAGKLLDSFVEKFPELLKKLIEAIGNFDFGELLKNLLDGVQKIADMIADNLPEIIKMLANTIVDFIKSIDWKDAIESGFEIMRTLIDGLLAAIPELIDAIPEIIEAIIEVLTDEETIEAIIEGAIKLVGAIILNIPRIIGSLLKAVFNIGESLIKGLWDGIKNVGKWLWDQITGFFGGIVDGIKGFFGIHSPSTLFRDEIGKNLALGLGDGFDKEMKTVAKDMENAIPTDFDADVQYTVGAAGGYRGAAFGGGTSNAYNQSFTININVDHMDNDTDLNALATNLSEIIAQQTVQKGNVYA